MIQMVYTVGMFRPVAVELETNLNLTAADKCRWPRGEFSYSVMLLY